MSRHDAPTQAPRAASRFAVVAWSGSVPIHLSPRGQRTQHLINALMPYGEIERVGGTNIPQWLAGDSERTGSSWHRRIGRALIYSVLMDKYEIAARRSLRSWSPNVDAAVLVGHPFSPLSLAATSLVRNGIPYIVDIGDPWVLTNPHPDGGWLGRVRATRWERKLWASARGVIVTTAGQGTALRTLFPHLRMLVRPNGYNVAAATPAGIKHTPAPMGDELRLVHYGSLYGARVGFREVFERLAYSGNWGKITLRQYGPDWDDALDSVSHCITVERRSPRSWAEVLGEAHTFHAAIVIGWRNPTQMPSKTVQYLTLPIPRIAIAGADHDDALATYVADKPGWAVVDDENSRAPEIVAAHLSEQWSQADLIAPECESWDAVESVLRDFALDAVGIRSSGEYCVALNATDAR